MIIVSSDSKNTFTSITLIQYKKNQFKSIIYIKKLFKIYFQISIPSKTPKYEINNLKPLPNNRNRTNDASFFLFNNNKKKSFPSFSRFNSEN